MFRVSDRPDRLGNPHAFQSLVSVWLLEREVAKDYYSVFSSRESDFGPGIQITGTCTAAILFGLGGKVLNLTGARTVVVFSGHSQLSGF